MTDIKTDNADGTVVPPPIRWWKRLFRLLVALAIIGVAVVGAAYLQKTAPQTKKRPPAKWVPLVQVVPLQPTHHQVVLTAMGTVIPARQIVLKSRVAGQILAVHPEFTEGGFLHKGDLVIQLDDADYKLALAEKKSNLVNSEYALELELGRQEVAQKEWQLLSGERKYLDSESDLALRKPHLDKANADLEAARAQVEKAALDLERTRITAPFNAIIRSKSVDIGSQVTAQEPLAELVGTDVYWVQASIPVDRLEWIQIPNQAGDAGSSVTVHYSGGHTNEGRVVRLMGDLASEGRMARILVEVKDPLGRQKDSAQRLPLLIGEYVRVEIEGRRLEEVFVVPRTALRDDATVWLLNKDMTLAIHTVIPVWRDADTVILKDDLKAGDQLIVSDLPAPVAGMEVHLEPNQTSAVRRFAPSRSQKGRPSDHE
jgi:RND family efflux transporter MFP subunit